MNKHKLAGIVLAASLLTTTTACGQSDDDKAAKAISASLMKDNKSMKLNKDQADCIGKGMVDKVGTKDLQKYGLLTKDLKPANTQLGQMHMSKQDADGAATSIVDCADAAKLITDSVASDQSMSPKAKDCMKKVLTNARVHDLFAALFAGDQQAAMQAVGKPMMACAGSAG